MATKLSILIPVYNEGPTVTELLERVWNAEIPTDSREIIIIESNSTDGSRERVQEFAKAKNQNGRNEVKVIYQEKPRGKGNALREGFPHATGDILLIQDADLEYSVDDYPNLISPILEGKTKFVLGSRHLSAGSWKIRTFEKKPLRSTVLNFGGIFFHFLFNVVFGQKLTDPTTMFKVFERNCLKGLKLVSDRFEFDYEILGKLIRAGYIPLEVPVSYASRGFEEGKKIRVFRDPPRWIWAIVKFRFSPLY